MPEQETNILIKPNGEIVLIYDDEICTKISAATLTQRASHVEPLLDEPGWSVDLTPVGGAVIKPFSTRTEALKYEKDYINKLLENDSLSVGPARGQWNSRVRHAKESIWNRFFRASIWLSMLKRFIRGG